MRSFIEHWPYVCLFLTKLMEAFSHHRNSLTLVTILSALLLVDAKASTIVGNPTGLLAEVYLAQPFNASLDGAIMPLSGVLLHSASGQNVWIPVNQDVDLVEGLSIYLPPGSFDAIELVGPEIELQGPTVRVVPVPNLITPLAPLPCPQSVLGDAGWDWDLTTNPNNFAQIIQNGAMVHAGC